jgi:hypothetical protein
MGTRKTVELHDDGLPTLHSVHHIKSVQMSGDGLYFVCDDGKRFIECNVEYEGGKWIVRGNDHIEGTI